MKMTISSVGWNPKLLDLSCITGEYKVGEPIKKTLFIFYTKDIVISILDI